MAGNTAAAICAIKKMTASASPLNLRGIIYFATCMAAAKKGLRKKPT
jgi:hypothetical protein